MKSTFVRLAFASICVALFGAAWNALAGEVGHFGTGVPTIRDFVLPGPGFHSVPYTYGYRTDRLNNRNGNKITSVTINPGPGPGVTLAVNGEVTLFPLAPTFIWVSDWKILGAKYGAYISPTFANSSIDAALKKPGYGCRGREVTDVPFPQGSPRRKRTPSESNSRRTPPEETLTNKSCPREVACI